MIFEMLIEDEYIWALRKKLPFFVKKVFETTEPRNFVRNWHIDFICEYLQAVNRKEITRLIINVPPGYTKSVMVNVAWSAYRLGINPADRIMSASHSYQLSISMSNKTRQVMESDWYKKVFPETRLKTDVENRQNFYATTENGHRGAYSVGGKVVGSSGDCLIIDDPIDASDTSSLAKIKSCNDWFDHSFYTRLRDKKEGAIVIIMQRLAEDDLVGHLLKGEIDKYHHISIPGIEDTLGGKLYSFGSFSRMRTEGELLCEAIDNDVTIAKAKERMGTYQFASQYQQRPAPLGGGVFKKEWIQFHDDDDWPDRFEEIINSWDTAYKPDEHNDPSACTIWGILGEDYYLIHVFVKHLEYPNLKAKMTDLYDEFDSDRILIENKVSGISLAQDFRLDKNRKLPIIPINPIGDKLTRAHSVTPKFESGRIHIKKNSPWLDAYLIELLLFPQAKHDDQVDSTTQFIKWAKTRSKKIINVKPIIV